MRLLVAQAAALLSLTPLQVIGQGINRSLINSESPAGGLEITVPADAEPFVDDPQEAENLLMAQKTIRNLSESLALANSEAEVFKRQVETLQTQLEAFGLSGASREANKVEQRLLAAVRDLRLLKQKNDEARDQLVRLIESVQVLIKSSESVDPAARLNVEAELRKTSEILGNPAAPAPNTIEPSLMDALVVDIKPELALVVGNIGSRAGVQIGMPFEVWRDNKRIANVKAVDVREKNFWRCDSEFSDGQNSGGNR
jgi:hypothetical protein